jgi:hypothetical protein
MKIEFHGKKLAGLSINHQNKGVAATKGEVKFQATDK